MKIKTLEYFITVAESRSINEAAKKLYIAQPGLTKALQGLEDEIGCTLLYRDGTGIRLTAEGEKILPEARQIVAYYNSWLALSQQSFCNCSSAPSIDGGKLPAGTGRIVRGSHRRT